MSSIDNAQTRKELSVCMCISFVRARGAFDKYNVLVYEKNNKKNTWNMITKINLCIANALCCERHLW